MEPPDAPAFLQSTPKHSWKRSKGDPHGRISFTDKLDAAGNAIASKAKELYGDVTDNEQLEAEGKAQQFDGPGQGVKGSIKGAFNDRV